MSWAGLGQGSKPSVLMPSRCQTSVFSPKCCVCDSIETATATALLHIDTEAALKSAAGYVNDQRG